MAEAQDEQAGASVPTLEVAELLPRLDRGEKLLLLDVRNQAEFDGWKLEARRPVETLHVPYFDFVEDADAAVARVPRGRDLVVLCAKGGSSELVAELLGEAGVPARNVAGGMLAYGAYLEPRPVPLPADAAARFALVQVNRRGKGCLSYVIVAGGEAVVVDPSRDAEWYADFVARQGARIVQVLDTHIHADHVSGGPGLARRMRVPYFVSAGAGFELHQPVTPLADGHEIRIGGRQGVAIQVRVIWTPGHTPGSTSFLVDGSYLLSGDTLFVSSVGRPDLGGHVEEWGRDLFVSLSRRLADLADDARVLPAHYSAVAEMSPEGVVWGRLGDLRASVPELQLATPEAFVSAVRGAVKDPPAEYARIIQVNLGTPASEEQVSEWELGKNQCAVAASRALGA